MLLKSVFHAINCILFILNCSSVIPILSITSCFDRKPKNPFVPGKRITSVLL
nr:MAG TPA: hypothetical protein [Caudoviricetes sp.]